MTTKLNEIFAVFAESVAKNKLKRKNKNCTTI